MMRGCENVIPPQRVLHTFNTFDENSNASWVSMFGDLAKCQKERGLIPEFSFLGPDHGATSTDSNLPIKHFNASQKRSDAFSIPFLKYLWEQKDIRINHIHSLDRMSRAIQLASQLKRIPCIVTVSHESQLNSESQNSNDFNPANAFGIHSLWNKIFERTCNPISTLNSADWINCLGENSMNGVKKCIDHDRIDYIPYGIEY